MRVGCFLSHAALSFSALSVAAQGPVLLKDINAVPPNLGSAPADMVQLGPLVLFTASTSSTGRELFRATGRPGSAMLAVDLAPGSTSSSPEPLGVVNQHLVLLANGSQVFATDGTATGTQQLARASGSRGPGSSSVNLLGELLFVLDAGPLGAELWKTDGTVAGTTLVKAFRGLGSLREFEVVGGVAYFNADDGASGMELWRTDGTSAGTAMVADIRPGANPSGPQHLTGLNGVLYLLADSGGMLTLWRSDGSSAGTWQIGATRASVWGAEPVVVFQGSLYFAALDPLGGLAVWRSDGTAAGTTLVVNPGIGGQTTLLGAFVPVGSSLLFSASGRGLFRTDGTAAGTAELPTLFPLGFQTKSGYAVIGNTVFFAGAEASAGTELWSSDGTLAGTTLVADVQLGNTSSMNQPFSIIANPAGQGLLFAADDGLIGMELWGSDGTTAGTRLLADLEGATTGTNRGSFPVPLAEVNGTTYLMADDGIHGYELWKTDGTPAGTVLVKDIHVGSAGSAVGAGLPIVAFGREVFFAANDGLSGLELWKSDGTAAGTVLVRDIAAGAASSFPNAFAVAGAQLFFAATDQNGDELWVSDGTTAGTSMVADIEPGPGGSFPRPLHAFGGVLLFEAYQGPIGQELWRSGGTAAGTQLVLDIAPGQPSSAIFAVAGLEDAVLFGAAAGGVVAELWRTDGTTAGTALVKGIWPAGSGAVCKGKAYFAALDHGSGTEVWSSDGTTAGTTLVKDIVPGPGGSGPASFVAATNGVLFTAQSFGIGTELWRTDGTAAGTVSLDLLPGPQGSTPLGIWALGSRQALLFALDPTNGQEPWLTDGTLAGSRRLLDLNPGRTGSNPQVPAVMLSGGRVLFNADGGVLGEELYVFDPGATAQPVGTGCGVKGEAARLRADDPVLGSTMALNAAGLTGTVGIMLFGWPTAPLRLPGTLCSLYLDPLSLVALATVPTAGGTFSITVPVPNTPVLTGLQAGVQAAAAFTPAPPGFELTNAVVLTLGT